MDEPFDNALRVPDGFAMNDILPEPEIHSSADAVLKRRRTEDPNADVELRADRETRSTERTESQATTYGPPEIDPDEISLLEEIGQGAFATVYRGICRQKNVAVKLLHQKLLDEKTLTALRHEIGIMSRIYHPNTVMFLGACTTAPGKYMIVTELLQRTVESMIFDPNGCNLNLITRMRMGKDAALGMLWLHSSNPTIIHRDLKLSNLLVDEHLCVKIGDFGLSQFKPTGEQFYLQDTAGGGIQGTPLWMAPEVMKGEPFNEKADVYSFGIVLWQLLTLREPFAEFDYLDDFVRAVCLDGTRPVVEQGVNGRLADLMGRCWAGDARARPEFRAVVKSLEQVCIELPIEDAVGRMFWASQFVAVSSVSAELFIGQLLALLRWNVKLDDVQRGIECLKALLVELDSNNHAKVSIENFGSFCGYFGPLTAPWLVPSSGDVLLLERLLKLLPQSWYHGPIESDECVRRLSGRIAGTFLVRHSSSGHGTFAISKVTTQGIVHLRVNRRENGNLVVQTTYCDSTVVLEAENIVDLIETHHQTLGLTDACAGSTFIKLFGEEALIEGYANE